MRRGLLMGMRMCWRLGGDVKEGGMEIDWAGCEI
jgi:hypothetical protein